MNLPHERALEATLSASAGATSWANANQSWLVAALAGLRERLESAASNEGQASEAVASAWPNPNPDFTPALQRCAEVFGLSVFERELLLLLAGVELDQGLRRAVAALQGQAGGPASPSFGMALALLAQPHWDAISPSAPLRHWRLLTLEPAQPLATAPLRIDERVLHYIAGVAANEPRLSGVARFVASQPGAPAPPQALLSRALQALSNNDGRGPLLVLHNEAQDACALRDAAFACAAALQRPLLWVAAQDLPADAAELELLADLIDREAALHDALPARAVHGQPDTALALLTRMRCTALWLGPAAAGLQAMPQPRRVTRLDWPAPDPGALSIGDPPALAEALRRARAQFHVNAPELEEIANRAAALPQAQGAAAVWAGAREAARGGLEALAQRITTAVSFADLVLPAAQMAALRDIARHLRLRDRVHGEWGFGDGQARGLGLTALFAGESGTGKTLAAEAIAQEAEIDLYRIDLATLVSKYIGETEKNLKRLFDAAQASGAVLLFDEADALFGKRSEVKDSHDRYANIEVAYLLQRIEAYRGLAILTTNMKSALDRAFLRRIRFVVTFPFPDAAAREQIWRRQFPQRAPRGSIDFAALARLHVAGGSIRSIALNAAFKAADEGDRIEQVHVLDAARGEFAKLERSFTEPAAARSTGAAHA